MKWGLILLFAVAIALVLLLVPKKGEEKGYVNFTKYDKVISDCVNLCLKARAEEIDLDNGPCLSDMYSWNHTEWVCDVAHWPRKPVDNLKENQCKNWGITAKNFVEVDPECRPIRIYVEGEGSPKVLV